jgi:hypothetical protein
LSSLFTPERRRSLRFIPGGALERMFPGGPDSLCTARSSFNSADRHVPADDGLAMTRGIVAGAVFEKEVVRWAKGQGFTVDLAAAVEVQLRKHVPPKLSPSTAALRTEIVRHVRDWQVGFPPEDGLAWDDMQFALEPQTDRVVARQHAEPSFALRIRPDIVVRLNDALIAVECSTAKSIEAVPSARLALNHFALLATVYRSQELRQTVRRVGTRVELLSKRTAYTRFLGPEEAEEWHAALIRAATAYLSSDITAHRGPWCNQCPYFGPCYFVELDSTDKLVF